MDQFLAKTPNPLLSITKDGIVNYSNDAAEPLLREWGVKIGENLPPNITDLVQRVISLNSPEKLDVKAGNRVYLVVFSPLPKKECVNISGFDITEHRECEDKIRKNAEKYSHIIYTTQDSNITEGKQAEEALFQSEQHYRLLYETMLQGVVYQDASGKIISMNPAAERILGKTSSELLGSSSVGEEYHTIREDGSEFPGLEHPAMVSLQTGQKVQNVVMGVYNPREKCYRWINISAVPLFRSGEDKPFQVYTLFEDITERKHMEEQTRLRAQELETIMEVVPTPILINHDLEGYNITGNRIANEFYRAEVGENISASVPKGGRFFYKGKELCADELPVQQAAKKNIDLRNVELEALLPSGKRRIITVSASPLYNTEGQVRGSVGSFTDITERKKAEAKLEETFENLENMVKERTSELENAYKSLKESEKDLAEAQRIAHIGSWKWNLLTDKISWSDEMYRIFGLKPQEDISLDKILNYIHPDDRDYLLGVHQESLKGKKLSGPIVFRIISPDGETRVIHGHSEVIFNEENKPVQIRGAGQDITENKKAEEDLRKSKEQYQSLFNSISEGFANCKAIYDDHGTLCDLLILDINPAGARISGAEREAQIGKTMREVGPDVEGYWFEAYKKVDQTGKSIQFENFGNMPGKWFTVRIDRIEKGQFAIMFRDITQEKEAKEALAKYEIAKKKEIHHRIKNNLQIISALLDLQAEKLKGRTNISNSELLNAFKESQDRIISMSLIHEELYRGGGTDKLNFSSYIGKLAENLILTYRVGNKDISLDMDLEENTFFDTDTAIPLGIIINELVSNSFKHAFQGRDKGKIKIRLQRDENRESKSKGYSSNAYILSVSDNGVGIPENIVIENLDSLGLQLVTSLADQLDGKLEIKRSNGTEFTVKFTVTEKE
ncbi:PAS domain-containing sensor histidine kinase [Methanosarcina sp. UBA5]|uniref:PAS domain-containing sensor histidine kinase n=1 Tax=Methanosarcina sp. UBA5 TaxID=1915593 RepID=UPI0025F20114|nr:PAS domain S-box protein [Methanosarcina sp. UBA5]